MANIGDILKFAFEELPYRMKMFKQFGPQWEEIEKYDRAMREAKMAEAAEAQERAPLSRDYMKAQTEYIEALKKRAEQPPPPPTSAQQWAEQEAQRKLNTTTPGTPEYVQAETEGKKKVMGELMKWAKDAVDPSTTFPAEFSAMTPAQQKELMEEYRYQVKERLGKVEEENAASSARDKRLEVLKRSAAGTKGKYGLGLAYPTPTDVEYAAMERLARERPSPIPEGSAAYAALEGAGGPSGLEPGMEPPQFPEDAPQSPEEATAKIASGDAKEVQATLSTLYKNQIPPEQWNPELMQAIVPALKKLHAEGLSNQEIRQQYPDLVRAWEELQNRMQMQGGGIGATPPGLVPGVIQ